MTGPPPFSGLEQEESSDMLKKIASIAFLVLVASSGVRADDPPSRSPNLERLRRLEAFTRTIPTDRLNMNLWASSTDLQDPTQDPDSRSYGCVAAWSTQLFASEGFRLGQVHPSGQIMVTYDGRYGTPACEAFFGISRVDAVRMFHHVKYNYDPAGAADVIVSVIRRHDPALDDLAQVFAPPPAITVVGRR
jgi:hypothetical protein